MPVGLSQTFGERMRVSLKIAVGAVVALFVVIIGAAFFLPLIESRSYYCFYCGMTSNSVRLIGVPVWRAQGRWIVYDDSVKTPPHEHRMIEICGFRRRLFRGCDNWDEFGWTGGFCREAMVAGVRAYPGRQEQIIREFLALDPEDTQAKRYFMRAYGTSISEPEDPASEVHPLPTEGDPMRSPQIEVLGVYRIPVSEALVEEQLSILYPDYLPAAERVQGKIRVGEQLESTVLIEARVIGRDARFDVADFTQPNARIPRDNWQVAWAEAFLTSDGESLAVERWSPAPREGELRLAFFMHYWQPFVALRTSYGEVACPTPQAMPARLQRLVPYEPVD